MGGAILSSDREGAVLCYENTAQKDFPLVLFVFREANNDSDISYSIGRLSSFGNGVGVWDMSYGIVARLLTGNPNKTPPYLKGICERKQSSPILFADCSPKPIDNHDSDKWDKRAEITTEMQREHVRKIFEGENFSDLLERVKVIFLAVGNEQIGNRFRVATDEYKKYADKMGILHIETRFMNTRGGNYKYIKAELEKRPGICQAIKEVAEQFVNSS